jgi:hypothetical protein
VIEMSQASWLAAGIVPGIEHHPLKKLDLSCPRFLWTPYCSEKLEDRQHGR